MAANSATSVVDLDFDTIKNNLKTFLQSQSNIQDYDYEGSNINTVLDVLSYNTFLNNFYINMIANEMFLDTATIRNSIISHAKELNYVPRSAHSAVAYVDVEITPTDSPQSINIDKYTKFTSSIGGVTYTFTADDDHLIRPREYSNGYVQYVANNIAIYEGSVVEEFFTVTSNTKFVTLSNENADMRDIVVNIRESNTSTSNSNWSRATTLFGLTPSSNVYFVEPSQDNKYNVAFGDGVFGRKPSTGNIVSVKYRVSNAEDGNRAKLFVAGQTIQGYSNIVVTTVANSSGGRSPEDVQDIKYNAPRSFQVQERAVTSSDYEILTLANFPEVQSVQAFGGQELTPPRFGKVIVAVDLADADGVSDSKSAEISEFLNSRTPVGIDAVVVSPEFMYLDVEMDVRYNIATTVLTPTSIGTRSANALLNYANSNINKFGTTFRGSKAAAAVDNAENSIISSKLTVRPYFIIPTSVNQRSYSFTFNNELKRDSILATNSLSSLYEPAVYSSAFTYGTDASAFFLDNGAGTLSIVRIDAINDRYIVLKNNAGTINYTTGKVDILPIAITQTSGEFRLYSRTVGSDIRTKNQIILQLNADDINTTVYQERNG